MVYITSSLDVPLKQNYPSLHPGQFYFRGTASESGFILYIKKTEIAEMSIIPTVFIFETHLSEKILQKPVKVIPRLKMICYNVFFFTVGEQLQCAESEVKSPDNTCIRKCHC